jgi:hypothetical protein
LAPSRVAISRASSKGTTLSVGRCISPRISRTEARVRTLSELDCARSVRSASATVGPSAESPAGDRKSATTTVSCAPKAPLPRSEAAGPMPKARLTMNPTTSAAKAPTATPPPIQVRRQETWGLALSARVASVPCAGTPPPGVRCGVIAYAR